MHCSVCYYFLSLALWRRDNPVTNWMPMDRRGRMDKPVGESTVARRQRGVDQAVQTDSACAQPPGGDCCVPRKRSCLWIDRLFVVQFVWPKSSSSYCSLDDRLVDHQETSSYNNLTSSSCWPVSCKRRRNWRRTTSKDQVELYKLLNQIQIPFKRQED